MALWLMQPSAVCFTVGFHATLWRVPGKAEKQPFIQEIQRDSPLHCHPNDVDNSVSAAHIVKAGKLHVLLSSIPRENPVWEAMRACWAALTMYSADRRYPFFWICLEALFGADDNSGEIGYKLCQRIAFFLGDSPEVARELFHKSKTCYRTRSKIIHGRWENDPKIDAVMADTEAIVRTVSRHLLDEPEMLRVFISEHRNRFLEDWVFSRSMSPPPYPKP